MLIWDMLEIPQMVGACVTAQTYVNTAASEGIGGSHTHQRRL